MNFPRDLGLIAEAERELKIAALRERIHHRRFALEQPDKLGGDPESEAPGAALNPRSGVESLGQA